MKCIECGRPATCAVGWPMRKEGPYPMCDVDEHHSVRNRNATSYHEATSLFEMQNGSVVKIDYNRPEYFEGRLMIYYMKLFAILAALAEEKAPQKGEKIG